jgi:AcrR family transcriptional regulator
VPKIDADTVAEHVDQQQRRVFEAAVSLFIERGYEQVTFGEIAERVGLARNSLYRYYPGKAEILASWIELELDQSTQRSDRILSRPGPATERIVEWAQDQIQYARRPEHALLVSFATALTDLDQETATRLRTSHDRLAEPLVATVRECGAGDEAELIARFIFALVNQASVESPQKDPQLLSLIRKAVEAMASE